MFSNLAETTVYVPLTKIIANRYQPRTTMNQDELKTLADSIKRNTMMQKPNARLLDDGCYELAFGHRRFEAYKLLAIEAADYETMPLIVRDLTNEQMFEFAWEENREREDLNPVDQGEAYITYMREFGKTSKMAGDYFHVSEETIRQKSRYTKLPELIKEKMRAGEINENTARGLLTMQKVAPEAVLVKTVKVIEENRENATPEEVIENSLEHMQDVVDMWDENRKDGKPHSAWSNGWLLDMKNFPNKLLPVLTPMDVAIALGVQDNQKVLKLVGEYLEYLDADSIGPEDETFDQDLHDACQGQAQKRLDALAKIDPSYKERIEHLINPPACTACPFHIKVRGSHYCGMKTCHTRKTAAWYQLTIQQASKDLGIAVYDQKDGRYVVLDSSDHRALFNSKHKGLRLILTIQVGKKYQYFSGIDSDVALVVATGEAIEKMRSRGSQVAGTHKTEKEKAEMRMMKIYRMRRKDFMWEFTAVTQSIFDGVPYEILLKINRWENVLMDDQPPTKVIVPDNAKVDDLKAVYQRRMLIWRLIMNDSSHYRRESMADMLKDFEKHAKDWKVKIPKSLIKLAQEWDAEIKAAATPRKVAK